MFKRSVWVTFASALLLLMTLGMWFNTLTAASPNMVTETMQEAVKVAVYDGPGVWAPSRIAIVNMYEWVGVSVTVVYASDVTGGGLVDYDVFVMPGGNAWDQYQGLSGEEGASRIRDFVNGGGGYIGICAGAYYACDYILWEGVRYDYPIGLFPGHGDGAIDEIAPWPNYAMTNISIVNRTHPITESLPDYMWILYYGGSEFHPYAGANVTILGRYEVNGEAAIVAFEYGSGRVFLSGPHPEIEEDSDRDDVSWGDWLDDQGSDWPLLYQAVKWLILRGDINDDGVVDIVDVAIVGQAFGSYPGHPRWNVNADLDCNDVINIIDIVKVAKEFGKTISPFSSARACK